MVYVGLQGWGAEAFMCKDQGQPIYVGAWLEFRSISGITVVEIYVRNACKRGKFNKCFSNMMLF